MYYIDNDCEYLLFFHLRTFMKEKIITGLDIGSTSVRVVVGRRSLEEDLRVIGVAEVPSRGVNRGSITSIEEAAESISACIEKAERIVGLPIESVWVGTSGTHITSQESKGVVAVSKINGEINEEDVGRAIEAARAIATPPNYEILHVIPKNFSIDEQRGIKDPIGMTGIRLEVDTQIIQGLSANIKNLQKCVHQVGLEIEDLVLSILATAEAVLTNRQKELGVAVADIGGSTTSLAVFEEGDVLHTAVLPIGSEHITSDIAIGLRTSIDLAEKIKLDIGSASPKEINKKEEIDLAELGGEEGLVSKKYIAEIIEARAEEIFERINRELRKIDRSGLLPVGIILTGGGAKLPGIIEVAKRKLKLPAALGYPVKLTSVIDKIHDLSFSTALGLVLWGDQLQENHGGYLGKTVARLGSMNKVIDRIKNLFKSIKP